MILIDQVSIDTNLYNYNTKFVINVCLEINFCFIEYNSKTMKKMELSR